MERHRLGRDVLAGPAQHERVEQLVGDEVAGRGVVLGPPGGRDPVAQVGLEAGPGQRHVGQHRHHVDHERLALGPVERLAPGRVDEREQVPGGLERARVAAGLRGGLAQALQDPGQAGDGFGRTGEVAVGLLAGQGHELLAVRGDDDRDAVCRGEHRLDGRQAGRRGRQSLAGPQRPDLIDRVRDALDRRDRVVRDAHLLEPQRQPGTHAHDDPAGEHLVEGGPGHRQHDRVTGERIDGAEGHPEAGLALHEASLAVLADGGRDRRAEAHRVALVVGVVDPDRIEAGVAGASAPVDDVFDVAPGGESETDRSSQGAHGGGAPCALRGGPMIATPDVTCSFALARFPDGVTGERRDAIVPR